MRYWFHSGREEAFALEVPPPDGLDTVEIDEDTYKEIVGVQPEVVLSENVLTAAGSEEALRRKVLEAGTIVAAPSPQSMDLERLARIWRKMDDAMDNLKADCEAEVAKIKVQQDQLSAVLLGQMHAMKADKLETVAGVIERKEETHVNAADWGAIWRFIVENNKFEFVQKRLTSSEILKWRAVHDALPPGMSTFTKYKLSVKKPGGRKALPKDDEGAN
jgi:hypothetical protein